MKNGDLVIYRYTQRGGYGFQRDVPAVFDCVVGKRIAIFVQKQDGSTKRIYVKPENVRDVVVPEKPKMSMPTEIP